MTDLVYIVAPGGTPDDIELRYSIRSMVKHLKGIGKLVIVGHCPEFINCDFYIPLGDPYVQNCARNIYEKILEACRHPDVSDQFICCGDDYFLQQDFQAESFPFYHCGDLAETISKLSKTNYYKLHVENTYEALKSRNLPTLNFNVHSPIVYDKKYFIGLMESYDWNIKRGYISKSLYTNSLRIPGEQVKDCKVHTAKTKTAVYRKILDAPVFSTNEHSVNNEMREVLQELYPDVSPWEITF